MRTPLDLMKIRNVYEDARYRGKSGIKPGHLLSRPLGATFGDTVRCSSADNPHGIHQGWDLYAPVGTIARAISSGKIVLSQSCPGYGLSLMLEFTHDGSHRIPKGRVLYALYGHLSGVKVWAGRGEASKVKEGDAIAVTGIDGNAKGGPAHLHFGISTLAYPTKSLAHWINPGDVLGYHYLNVDQLLPRIEVA